jgi:hypothetical protein
MIFSFLPKTRVDAVETRPGIKIVDRFYAILLDLACQESQFVGLLPEAILSTLITKRHLICKTIEINCRQLKCR